MSAPARRAVLALAAVTLLAAFTLATTAHAKPKSKGERYYLTLVGIEGSPGADDQAVATITPIIKEKLAAQLAARGEFVDNLAGAPDPKADPNGFDKWAARKKLRAFEVRIKIVKYKRTLAPVKDSSDQMLTVDVELQLLGAKLPLGTVGMTGSGSGTISAQVGKKVTAKIDADMNAQAIDGALSQSLDEAVRQLRANPAKTK